jgi:hypothetical protein
MLSAVAEHVVRTQQKHAHANSGEGMPPCKANVTEALQVVDNGEPWGCDGRAAPGVFTRV